MGRIRTVLSFAFGLGGLVSGAAPVMLDPAEVSREFQHRAWRHEQGLPDNRVKAILQTRDGYFAICRGADGERWRRGLTPWLSPAMTPARGDREEMVMAP